MRNKTPARLIPSIGMLAALTVTICVGPQPTPALAHHRCGHRTAVCATPTASPAAPATLSATAGNTQVALSWASSAGATGYRVLRAGTLIAAPTSTSFTDTGLTNGVGYTYTVRAVNSAGSSADSPSATASPSAAVSTGYFAADSPFNASIPAAPRLDANSTAVVNYLSSGTNPGFANLYEFGVPIWNANSSTGKYAVDCLMSWGTCELEQQPVPIPTGAGGSSGSDGAMVVVDPATRTSYEFWQFDATRRTTSWGGRSDLNGQGVDGEAVGSNVSRLAGVVRIEELQRGYIDHALVFSTNNACSAVLRYPAQKTDGNSSRTDCIPEGARVQLDPDLDLSALPTYERIVAEALQTYGAYAIDNGGGKMAFSFEMPSGETDPYPAMGWWDYYAMNRIPWTKLRVLNSWNGS